MIKSPVNIEKSATGARKKVNSPGGGAGFRHRLLPLTAERNNREHHHRNFTNTSTFYMSESVENASQFDRMQTTK